VKRWILPPHSDELISEVLKANPNTVAVIQSGTPVSMPWIGNAKAVVHAWYGGNKTGNSIADITYGDVNPVGPTLELYKTTSANI
jgi:beta-glucosidase